MAPPYVTLQSIMMISCLSSWFALPLDKHSLFYFFVWNTISYIQYNSALRDLISVPWTHTGMDYENEIYMPETTVRVHERQRFLDLRRMEDPLPKQYLEKSVASSSSYRYCFNLFHHRTWCNFRCNKSASGNLQKDLRYPCECKVPKCYCAISGSTKRKWSLSYIITQQTQYGWKCAGSECTFCFKWHSVYSSYDSKVQCLSLRATRYSRYKHGRCKTGSYKCSSRLQSSPRYVYIGWVWK